MKKILSIYNVSRLAGSITIIECVIRDDFFFFCEMLLHLNNNDPRDVIKQILIGNYSRNMTFVHVVMKSKVSYACIQDKSFEFNLKII